MWRRTANLVRRRSLPSVSASSFLTSRIRSNAAVSRQRGDVLMTGSILNFRYDSQLGPRCFSQISTDDDDRLRFKTTLSTRQHQPTESSRIESAISFPMPANDIPPVEGKRYKHPPHLRTQVSLALCSALVQQAQAQHLPARRGSVTGRFLSSTKDSGAPQRTNNEPKENKQARTEPDFADYLNKPDVDPTAPSSTSSASGNGPQGTAQPPDLPPQQETHQSLSNENALYEQNYKYIRRKQLTALEKARQKTAANVRRALVGNVVICVAKFGAWISSGSSSMLSELVHSVVDCGNQSLLLLGLHDSGNVADRKHPYGYGKSVYFWALVSALGTFFLGAGVSATHAVGELMEPSLSEITLQVWGVLGVSFVVDGWVFTRTVRDIRESMPDGKTSFLTHVWTIRDPAMLAVLLEDGAACMGIVMAIAGIAATHATGMPVFDGLAGVSISALLAAMGVALVRVNHRFLLGHAIDNKTIEGIQEILLNRRSIDNVHSVQSQWTGPDTFSYKAEVDFDGTYLAAKLMPRYQREFLEARDTLDKDLRVLLSWYAEDVMRTVEREVRHIEAEIREEYPGAEFIELEPMSKEMDRFAIDDGMETQLRRIEIEALNRYLKSLYPKSSGRSVAKEKPKSEDGPIE